MRLILRFFATAMHHGAEIRNYMDVTELLLHDGLVSGAVVHDYVNGKSGEVHAHRRQRSRAVVWQGAAVVAGVSVPMNPSPGVLLALRGRLGNMVLNTRSANHEQHRAD